MFGQLQEVVSQTSVDSGGSDIRTGIVIHGEGGGRWLVVRNKIVVAAGHCGRAGRANIGFVTAVCNTNRIGDNCCYSGHYFTGYIAILDYDMSIIRCQASSVGRVRFLEPW